MNEGLIGVILLITLLSVFLLVIKGMVDKSNGKTSGKERRKKERKTDPEANYQDLIKRENLRSARYKKNIPGARWADKLLSSNKDK